MFSDLDKLKIGDVFYLQVLDETLAYQVDQINTVLPHDTTYLGITEGEDNCLLGLVPSEVLDYVVVHELCHRKELNHSDRFWNEVSRILPDYKTRKQWLKDNGPSLIARI